LHSRKPKQSELTSAPADELVERRIGGSWHVLAWLTRALADQAELLELFERGGYRLRA
jgi:hypothetical protein